MDRFVGKWSLVSSENFDEYLKAAGVGLITRKAITSLKSSQDISLDGDVIILKTISTFKSTEVRFKLGETFDETTGDGRKMKTTYKLEGDVLVAEQVPVKSGEVGSNFRRSINADGTMLTLCEAGGVTAKRIHKKD